LPGTEARGWAAPRSREWQQVDLVEGVECGDRATVLHHSDRPDERDKAFGRTPLQVVSEGDDLDGPRRSPSRGRALVDPAK
jgi:hypothetical protein